MIPSNKLANVRSWSNVGMQCGVSARPALLSQLFCPKRYSDSSNFVSAKRAKPLDRIDGWSKTNAAVLTDPFRGNPW